MHARKSLFLIRKSQIPTRPLIILAVEQASRRWTVSDQSLQRISGSRITERADPNETPASQGVDFKSYRWPSVTGSFALAHLENIFQRKLHDSRIPGTAGARIPGTGDLPESLAISK